MKFIDTVKKWIKEDPKLVLAGGIGVLIIGSLITKVADNLGTLFGLIGFITIILAVRELWKKQKDAEAALNYKMVTDYNSDAKDFTKDKQGQDKQPGKAKK